MESATCKFRHPAEPTESRYEQQILRDGCRTTLWRLDIPLYTSFLRITTIILDGCSSAKKPSVGRETRALMAVANAGCCPSPIKGGSGFREPVVRAPMPGIFVDPHLVTCCLVKGVEGLATVAGISLVDVVSGVDIDSEKVERCQRIRSPSPRKDSGRSSRMEHHHFCLAALVASQRLIAVLIYYYLVATTLKPFRSLAQQSTFPQAIRAAKMSSERPSVLILGGINTVARHLAVFLCGRQEREAGDPKVKVRSVQRTACT